MRGMLRHLLSRGACFRGVRTGSGAAKSATGPAGRCIRADVFPAHDAEFMNGRATMYARRKGEHGSAILESFLSMILLGMILFGILQLFQLALADMVTDYAAFRGARSAAVHFRNRYSPTAIRSAAERRFVNTTTSPSASPPAR